MSSFSPCHHTFPTGKSCGSPSLRGEQHCFYHHPTRRAPRRRRTRKAFGLPPLIDAKSVQIALSEILCRIADDTLDTRRANLLLHTLQIARANLSALPDESYQRSYPRAGAPASAREGLDPQDLSALLAILSADPTAPFPEL
jgi:hypothetical protein